MYIYMYISINTYVINGDRVDLNSRLGMSHVGSVQHQTINFLGASCQPFQHVNLRHFDRSILSKTVPE